MRTIRIKAYKFDELSDSAKETVLNHFQGALTENYWWEFTYEDAKNIGLKITSFDLDRNRHAKGHFILDAGEVADKIIVDHGKDCQTYKTAKQFVDDWNTLVEKYSDGIETDKVTEENEYDFDNDMDDLEAEFLESLLEDYSIMLQKECDYLDSEESLTDFITSNDYEFTKEGKLI